MSTTFPVRPIGIFAFPGVESLDITGPYEVFSFANVGLQKQGVTQEIAYPVTIFAEKPGPVTTFSGLQIVADKSYSQMDEHYDTLLFPGGDLEKVKDNTQIVELIKALDDKMHRLVSVCTGAFLLAESGRLDGLKATTHWNWCRQLAEEYPKVAVEPDRIFVKDGNILTSGGITSGIDLALAMVEEDWGQEIALHVARFLVMFLKRPGGQSQFSSYLASEATKRSDIRDLQVWIMQHPEEDLRVEMLAERVAMSPRNFARQFFSETGITPAKFVEMVRIDAARNLLEMTKLPIASIANNSGFKDAENMRRAFLRQLGVKPSDYRQRFGPTITDNNVTKAAKELEHSRFGSDPYFV